MRASREVVAELGLFVLSRNEAAEFFAAMDEQLAGLALGALPRPFWYRGECARAPVASLVMKHTTSVKRSGRLYCNTVIYSDLGLARRPPSRPPSEPPSTLRSGPKAR